MHCLSYLVNLLNYYRYAINIINYFPFFNENLYYFAHFIFIIKLFSLYYILLNKELFLKLSL